MIKEKYELWCKKAVGDPDLVAELKAMEGNEELISEAFYKDLEFGTPSTHKEQPLIWRSTKFLWTSTITG